MVVATTAKEKVRMETDIGKHPPAGRAAPCRGTLVSGPEGGRGGRGLAQATGRQHGGVL